MCPAQRDTLTGHFFASLCPLRQFANCFALSATFPQGTQGRLDFIAGHFYVSRSTGHSDRTLFFTSQCPVLTNRFPEFGVQHEGTGAGGVSTVLFQHM